MKHLASHSMVLRIFLIGFFFLSTTMVSALPESLTVSSSNNFPPINNLDEQGELIGFGRDISDAVLREMGVDVKRIHSPKWNQVLQWLDSGDVDLIHDTGYTKEREKYLDFSAPIIEMSEVIFVQSQRLDIHDMDSLNGKVVACVRNHITHIYLKGFPQIECFLVNTPLEGLHALSAGKVDAFIYPRKIIEYYAQKMSLTDKIKIAGEPLRTLVWSMTVKKGNKEVLDLINQGIAKVKASGEYERIYNKWFGRQLLSGYTSTQVRIVILVTVLFSLLISTVVILLLNNRRILNANKSVKESEEKLRTILDGVEAYIYLKDLEGNYLFANRAVRDLWQVGMDDIVGFGDEKFFDVESAENIRQNDRRVLLAGETLRTEEVNVVIETGVAATYRSVKLPLHDDNGDIYALCGISADITDQKLAEQSQKDATQRMSLATDATGIGFWEWNLRSNTINWDARMFEIYGILPTDDGTVEYHVWKDAVSDNEIAEQEALLQETIRFQKPGRREFRIKRHGDDVERIIEAVDAIRLDSEGNPEWVVGTNIDITERKNAEKEQARLHLEIQQSQKMQSLGKLAGGIAHDFNNILGIVTGYTELAQHYADVHKQEKLSEYMSHVSTASERGKELIKQMLTYSRNQSNELLPLSLTSLVKEDLKMLRSTLPTSIEIKSEIPATLPLVNLTPVMLNQILMNLLVNACDAMDKKGTVSVYLGMTRAENVICNICHKSIDGEWVELAVGDKGSGINAVNFERIFEPFYTTKEVGKGTGMGLSMVSGIMRDCGGHVLVESEIGVGTTLRLLFPPVSE